MLEGSEQPAKSIFSLQNKPQTRHRQRKRARQRARPPGTRTRHAHLTVPVRAHTHACMRARAPTHQQPPISGARVGRRLQLLSPRLPCGLGIRLAAAAPAALAFARRHCSRVLWHPAWRRPLACLGSASSPSPLWTDAALLVPLVPAACVVLLLLLPFFAVAPQRLGRTPPSQTHAQASQSQACSSRSCCSRRRRKRNCQCDGPGLPFPGPWVPPPPVPPPLVPRLQPPAFCRKSSQVEASPCGWPRARVKRLGATLT